MLKSIKRKVERLGFSLRFKRYAKKEVVGVPQDIQLEPTVRCNLSCLTCSRDSVIDSYSKKDLSLEEIDKILSFFPRLKSIKLQGLGEPLLHPEIEAILKKFKQKKIKVWLITNGTLLHSQKCRDLLLEYVSDVAVSFDSVDKEVFNYLRRNADFDKIAAGTKELAVARNKSSSAMTIGINFVLSHKNYRELEKLPDFAAGLGVDYVAAVQVENWMLPGEQGYQESLSFVKEARKYSPQINIAADRLMKKLLLKGIMLGYKDERKRLGNCYWPFKSAYITVEGLVTPCCIRMHRGNAFGNIFQAESLADIWDSQMYRDFRKSHINKDCGTNLICANCPD